MRILKFVPFIILTIIGYLFQGCNNSLPKIGQGEFFVKSSLINKIVAGEEMVLNYHIRKGEQVECFNITFTDSLRNTDEQFYQIIKSNDSIVSLKLLVPKSGIKLYVLVVSNYNCKTEGYASAEFLICDKNGKLSNKALDFLVEKYYDNNDTLKADSLIKESLITNPENLNILNGYWYWLKNNNKLLLLQSEINKIKQLKTKKPDEKYAILCRGYYYLNQIDSTEAYLEKYIANSDNPYYASDEISDLSYLYYNNDKEFKNHQRFNRLIAQKCPLSKSADFFLEEVISLGIRDTLAERIIANKLNDSKEALYFETLYSLRVLNDTAKTKNAALKYFDFNKKSYFPKTEISNEVKYLERTPKIYRLLSEISKSTQESYNYIIKAIEYNRECEELASLHSKAAQLAFILNDKSNSEFHLKQICKQGKLLVAQKTLNEIYPNANNAAKLSDIFQSSAALCDSIPDLTFTIDASTKITTRDKKILFINLWSPVCSPCIKEIPQLNKLRNSFTSDSICWLARDYGKEYMDKLSTKLIGWSLYQKNEEINKVLFKQSAIPQTYIIDKNKKVRYHSIGIFNYANDEEKLVLEMLLNEK